MADAVNNSITRSDMSRGGGGGGGGGGSITVPKAFSNGSGVEYSPLGSGFVFFNGRSISQHVELWHP